MTVGAASGAGIGAAAGGLLGSLTGAGVSEEDAHVYAEGVRRGGTLVTVRAEDADAARVGTVPPKVFWPVPNVDSGLVRMTRREPPATTATRQQVFAVVDAAFAQRRKMLRGALAGLFGSSSAASEALEAAGVDPQARGEVIDVAAFARIAERLPGAPA